MQSKVDAPCPQCSCGWKHTDFIPSDGEKPGYSSLIVDEPEKCSARVVRSSSCTIRIPELDLEVSPGGSSSGFVSNIEGVINRFEDAVGSIMRGNSDDEKVLDASMELLEGLRKMKDGGSHFLIELLDPRGRSQIIHSDANIRELMENEKQSLDMGPEVPVFDIR